MAAAEFDEGIGQALLASPGITFAVGCGTGRGEWIQSGPDRGGVFAGQQPRDAYRAVAVVYQPQTTLAIRAFLTLFKAFGRQDMQQVRRQPLQRARIILPSESSKISLRIGSILAADVGGQLSHGLRDDGGMINRHLSGSQRRRGSRHRTATSPYAGVGGIILGLCRRLEPMSEVHRSLGHPGANPKDVADPCRRGRGTHATTDITSIRLGKKAQEQLSLAGRKRMTPEKNLQQIIITDTPSIHLARPIENSLSSVQHLTHRVRRTTCQGIIFEHISDPTGRHRQRRRPNNVYRAQTNVKH